MPTILNPRSTNPEVRLRQKIAELEARIATLERKGSFVPILDATPTDARAGLLQGTDIAGTSRIWLNVNGTWKSVVVS